MTVHLGSCLQGPHPIIGPGWARIRDRRIRAHLYGSCLPNTLGVLAGSSRHDEHARNLFHKMRRTIAMILVLSAPAAGLGQSVNAKVDETALPNYHPSMGDLMTMAIQPRHVKLGLAGQQKNWAYAKYELSELRNAFARIGRTIPTYQSVATAALTVGVMGAPLNAVEQAIDAKSATEFNAAYVQLTEACNICHRNRAHSAVVIKAPDTAGFPDQDFVPISPGSLQ